MRDTSTLTADMLLGIPPDAPERLFPGDAARVRSEYRRLATLWHPDRRPDACAAAVFARIAALHRLALERLSAGDRRRPGVLTLRAAGGAARDFAYRRQHRFELGRLYIAPDAVAFVLDPAHADLLDNAVRRCGAFRFAGAPMRDEMSRALPQRETRHESPDGPCLVLRKARRLVLLRDLVDRLGGALEPRHVAWVLSSLYNLACYLEFAGIAHNAIGLDTYFVDPEGHGGALLGGWWYAARIGRRLTAVPARTAGLLPPDLLASRTADPRGDLELIRATGRELLGDPAGVRLSRDAAVPRALAAWLCGAGAGAALADYALWQDVLRTSFGARRFVRLGITASDIYG